jgi:hypothetical protein
LSKGEKPLPRLSQGEGLADIARTASLPDLKRDENEACAHIEIIKPKQLTTNKVLLDSSAMTESSPSGGVEGAP